MDCIPTDPALDVVALPHRRVRLVARIRAPLCECFKRRLGECDFLGVTVGRNNSHGELSADGFHQRYDAISKAVDQDRDQTPISKRQRRTKLQKLVDCDLLGCDGNGPARTYCACDSSIDTPLDVAVPVS
ncbi:hypothetical protein ACOJIV_17960 [Haloarcula sp. AONF1]